MEVGAVDALTVRVAVRGASNVQPQKDNRMPDHQLVRRLPHIDSRLPHRGPEYNWLALGPKV
jgi:hypothetical protein